MTTRFRRSLVLLCTLAFALAAPLPALAASFNFSYVFNSGKVLQGTFNGTPSGDTISNLSAVMATYDSSLVVATNGSGAASFSGNFLAFGGITSDGLGRFGFAVRKTSPQPIVVVSSCATSTSCTFLEFENQAPSRWSVTQTGGGAPVPEPTAAALFGLGTLFVGRALHHRKRD